MIKFYVHKDQLYNFLILKEPVEFYPNVMDEKYFEVLYDAKDIIITTYRTYSTVELKTFRKVWKRLWQKKNN